MNWNLISKNLILLQITFQDAKDVSKFFDSKQEFGSEIFQISLEIHKRILYFINLGELHSLEIFELLGKKYTDGVFSKHV